MENNRYRRRAEELTVGSGEDVHPLSFASPAEGHLLLESGSAASGRGVLVTAASGRSRTGRRRPGTRGARRKTAGHRPWERKSGATWRWSFRRTGLAGVSSLQPPFASAVEGGAKEEPVTVAVQAVAG
jgi:hypothetical protein